MPSRRFGSKCVLLDMKLIWQSLGEWNVAAREEGVCRHFCAQEGKGERDGREGAVSIFFQANDSFGLSDMRPKI